MEIRFLKSSYIKGEQVYNDFLNNTIGSLEEHYDDKIANNDMSNQTLIMQQFAADKKDLVFAVTTPTAQAAKNQVTGDIPVVFASVTDPKSAGLEGIANVTGTSGAAPVNENLKLMRELLPEAKKIGIINNSSVNHL